MSPKADEYNVRPVSPKPRLSQQRRHRLANGLAAEIRRLESLRRLLGHVDREVFEAGMDLFESESALALWLCAPAPALNGKRPLNVMHTARGRQQVAQILRSIAHGVIL